jgi:hypothetical protein
MQATMVYWEVAATEPWENLQELLVVAAEAAAATLVAEEPAAAAVTVAETLIIQEQAAEAEAVGLPPQEALISSIPEITKLVTDRSSLISDQPTVQYISAFQYHAYPWLRTVRPPDIFMSLTLSTAIYFRINVTFVFAQKSYKIKIPGTSSH